MSKYIKLNPEKLRSLRQQRGFSQEAASWECQHLSLHISEATFKRAESGKAILYRTANDFSTLFNIPLAELIEEESTLTHTIEPSRVVDDTFSTVLLGRDFEVLQFKEALNICRHNRVGRLLSLRGVPGIGKSRLLAEFNHIAQASNISFYSVSIKQIQGSNKHSALAELLQKLLHISPTQVDEKLLQKCSTRLKFTQSEQIQFCSLLGIKTPSYLKKVDNSISVTQRITNEQDLLFKLISTLHSEQPCVIAFDDVHWSDDSLILTLRTLSSSIQNLPIVLILATRPENDPIDAIWRSYVVNTPTITLDLSPLNNNEAEIFAQFYQTVEEDYVKQALQLSEGNPLFMEQLLMNYPCRVGCFPNDLRELMKQRLQTLDQSAQQIINAASVIGSKINLTLLDFMLDDNDYDLNPMIQQLIIRPLDADNIEFCHDLVRQGFYENLEQQEKLGYHTKASEWYLTKDKRLYAQHLTLSESYKTLSAFFTATEKQATKHNYGAALSLIDNVLAIPSSKPERYLYFITRGLILKQLDLPEKSLKCFSDAIDHADNFAQCYEAYLEMAYTFYLLHRHTDALRIIKKASIYKSNSTDQNTRYQYLLQQISKHSLNKQDHSIGMGDSEDTLTSSQHIAKVIQKAEMNRDELLSLNSNINNHSASSTTQTIKVGILHSQSGNLRQLEIGVIRTTLMAIGEINQKGGLLGHLIEPIIIDGKSSEKGFHEGAESLINDPQINTIFGCSTSSSRRTVKPLIESNKHLLIYPFQYEGIEQSEHIFYVGPAPNQTALPAIEWLFHKQHHSYYLLGSDNVYPRVTNLIIKQQLSSWQLDLVEEKYVPLACTNFGSIIDDIKARQPDVVVLTLVGLASNKDFFRQFHQSGLDSSKITLLSLVLSENDLIDIPTEYVAGTHSVFTYFQNTDSPVNEQFIRRYKQCFGSTQQLGGYMESAYVGVNLWAKAVQQAKSFERDKIRKAMKGVAYFGPGGIAYIDEENGHVWRHVQVAKVSKEGGFQPLWCSKKPIKPEPFPLGHSQKEWLQHLEKIQQTHWQGNWEKICPGRHCPCRKT